MCTLTSSAIEYSENISIIWENATLSFRICLGVIKSHYKTRRCVQTGNRTHWKKRMVPTWDVCAVTWLRVTRCWPPVCVPWSWHLTTPILPGTGCSRPRLPFRGCTLPSTAKGPQAATSEAKFQPGVWFAKSGVSPFEKQARKTESYHVSACSGKIWP